MSNNQYHIESITKLDETQIFQWKKLWNKAENANIFNAYEWFLTCTESLKQQKYVVYLGYQDKELVAVLPLCVDTKFGVRVLRPLGKDFLVDTAFLIDKYDTELLKTFFSHLKNETIFIPKVDEKIAGLLHSVFSEIFFTLLSVNPTLNLTLDLAQSITKSTRDQVKKVLRQNPEQFTFSKYIGEKQLEKHLPQMFEIDLHSAKQLRSMDLFSKKENVNFFTALCEYAPEFVQLYFLNYQNMPVAYQFGFLYKNTFVAYQTSYLSEYRKFRPGKTMLMHLIEKLKAENVTQLDLGGGISVYKQEFTKEYRLLYDVYFSPNSLIMFWWKGINKIRRLKQILFPKKFTQDHEFLFKTI